MTVRWTRAAAKDMEDIARHIRKDNVEAARKVALVLFETGNSLSALPRRGRLGRIPGTREIIFPGWPYILVYQITEKAVEILRVYHAAQDWP